MSMRNRGVATALWATVAVVTTTGPATAADASVEKSRADVTVTAEAYGPGYVWGEVSSSRDACVSGRQVRLMQQIGTRGGGDDLLFHAPDIDEVAAGYGTWAAGFALPAGKYYAVMKRTPDCRRDTSTTVTVH